MATTTIEPLSYSSSNELLGCEQKYVYRKVQKIDRDADAPMDTLAMDIGSTLHKCLEDCNHDLKGFNLAMLKDRMIDHKVPEEQGPMLWAMLRKYKDLHEHVGLKCKATEVRVEDKDFIGFIDLILEEPDGSWWITDLKTAASISRFLPARLPLDRQLNLYAHKYGKDEAFKGCRYRVVTKSKAKFRKDDTFNSFSDRIYGTIAAVEYVVPKEVMVPDSAGEQFEELRKIQKKLWKGTKKPIRNFGNCDSYFRPCEYWSKCHGAEYTDTPRVTEISV